MDTASLKALSRRPSRLALLGAVALGVCAATRDARAEEANVTAGAEPSSALPTANEPRERRSEGSPLLRDPVFVEVAGGPTFLTLLAVRGSRSAFPNMVSFSGWGPGARVTAGLHALVFSVGVQAAWTRLSGEGNVLNPSSDAQVSADGTFSLFTTTLVGALRLPLGRVEPSFRLGMGYARMSGFASSAATGLPDAVATGWTVQAGLGFDVRVWRRLLVGFGVDAAVANVRRSGLSGSECSGANPFCAELQQDGDAISLMVFPYLSVSGHLF